MKKSFKHSVCKAITTFACASFFVAGMIGLNSISAKAATTNWTIDLSNGKEIVADSPFEDESEQKIAKEYKDIFLTELVMSIYDPDIKDGKKKFYSSFTSVFSKNPYQGVTYEENKNNRIIKAASGSLGVGKYVISKDTIMRGMGASERTAKDLLTICDLLVREQILNRKYNERDDVVNDVYIVEIKYSDVPVITNSTVNGAPSVSFEIGRELEDNGIKYRIIDAAGNLSAIGLTSDSKNVTISDNVNCSGYNLTVTDIAQNFMKRNKKAKKVTIGANVASIGKEAFYKCKKLKKVTVKSTKIASIGKKAFGKNAKGFTVKLPKSCKKAYKKLLKKAKIKL